MNTLNSCSVVKPPVVSGSFVLGSITCQSCGSQLPIRPALPVELPALWQCVCCGSHHRAALPPEARQQTVPNVALAGHYFDCQPAQLEHEWTDALIEHLHHQEIHTAIQDKRTSPRVARNLHAQVIAVEESWAPRGRSFPVIVYNISTGGLAYVSATINRAPIAAIQIAAGHKLQVIAQSVWAHPEHGGLFSVGVKFLCRLGTVMA